MAIPADDKLDELLDRHLAYDDPRLGESERSQIVEVLAELDRGGQDADTAFVRIDDWQLAQTLADQLVPAELHRILDRYAKQCCPVCSPVSPISL